MAAAYSSVPAQNLEEELDLPGPSCMVDDLEREQCQNIPEQGCTPEPNSSKIDRGSTQLG
jgi:hypothetical protein